MAKSAKNQPFLIKPHTSKSGKSCFVWNWKDTGFRVENVKLLKSRVESLGGWYKFNTSFSTVYLGGLTLVELTAIFNEFKWSKPEPKPTKVNDTKAKEARRQAKADIAKDGTDLKTLLAAVKALNDQIASLV